MTVDAGSLYPSDESDPGTASHILVLRHSGDQNLDLEQVVNVALSKRRFLFISDLM